MTASHRGVRIGARRCHPATAQRGVPVVALVRVALVGLAALVVAACAGDTAPSSSAASAGGVQDASGPRPAESHSGTIVVSAASSLGAAFDAMAAAFTDAHPEIRVELNVDGSSSLATQVLDGAPVDVFAAADGVTMARVADAGLLAGPPIAMATNQLVIVTAPANPAGIATLADLTNVGVVALCGAEVPCGRYAQQVLAQAGVVIEESSVTRGQNAGVTLAAVASGDAVAGVVYVTDAIGAGDTVATVPIPASSNVVATYPIGVVSTSTNAATARAFVDWVLGPAGQRILARFGFGPPR